MQQIKDTLSGAADKAGEFAGQAGNRISEFAGSEEMKKLMPYLLAGGAGAAAGGLLTDRRRAKKGESRTSHLGRVLGNALMAGGLAAGSTALISKGLGRTTDAAQTHTSAEPDEGPLAENLKDFAFSPVTAGLSGAAGLYATHKLPGFGADVNTKADDLANFVKKLQAHTLKPTASDLRGYSPQKIQEIVDSVGGEGLNNLRRRAGLGAGGPSALGKIKGIASKVTRGVPLSTFGQTVPRRIGRTGVGLFAAALPGIIGAALTKETPESNA